MKKHITFIASFMLAGLVGCNEDPNIGAYESIGTQSLIATMPTTSSRIAITDGESSVSLNWVESDKFSVYTSEGDYVADFIYSSLSSSDNAALFVTEDDDTELVDNAEYIAIFPSADGITSLAEHRKAIEDKVTTQEQDGNNSKEHFNDHLLLEAQFTYSSSSNTVIAFKHKMAAIRLTFEGIDGTTPKQVIFDDGSFASYTLNFSNTTAAEQYTANYVILPNEEGIARELKATIVVIGSDETEVISDFSIESSAKYSAGVQYRSQLSIDDVTMDISTLEELIAFRDAVNSGSTSLDANLIANINLKGSEDNQWIPIATDSDGGRYSGTFNGGGHTISGLYINDIQVVGAALFGACDGATVMNLTVEGEVTNKTTESTAAFAGYAYNSTFSNCSTTAATKISGTCNNTAGIVAYLSLSKLDNCTNNATIIGSRNVGGLVGYVTNEKSSYISNCTNNGAVSDDNATADTNSIVGGVIGRFQGLYGSITNCVNNGTVTCYYEYTGGIVAYCSYSNINNCYNTADVNGGQYCGGISGYFYSATVYGSAIINSYNSGNVYTVTSGNTFYIGGITGMIYASRVANSYNTGNIGSSSNSWQVGGILGWNYTSSLVSACYNVGQISAYYNGGQLVASNSSTSSVVYSYSNTEVSSVALIASDDASSSIVSGYNTEYMQSAAFVDVMNDAAYKYNLTEPNIKAYGWAFNSGGYPVIDSTVTPEATEPIKISSAKELAKIGVEAGYSYYDSYILTEDINLNNETWTPIGEDETNAFRGTFDGAGFSITGLLVSGTESGQGLFATCYNATIKNLKVGGSVSNSDSHVGIIAGKSWYTSFENCETLDGSTVTATSGDSHAGISGYGYNCSFSSCINRADVFGVNCVAGIVGYVNDNSSYTPIDSCVNYGAIEGSTQNVGGIVATTNSNATLVITNCDNYGAVTEKSKKYVAGIAATIYQKSTIDNCNNYGAISGTGYVAGIVGLCNNDSYSKTITNCYNEGNITGTGDFAGGVAAKLYGVADNASTIINCANVGIISGSSNYVGGLAGANQGGVIYNSYNLGEITGTSSCSGGLVGIHEKNDSHYAAMENCYTSAAVTSSGSNSVGLAVGKCDGATITSCYYNSTQSGSEIGTNNDSQSVTAYTSLSELLSSLNSASSTIENAAIWVADSNEYPSFGFIE